MHTRNVVMNQHETKILSIPIKDREKGIQNSISPARYSDSLYNPKHFYSKPHVNKYIKPKDTLTELSWFTRAGFINGQ